ncbi:hypothetical protein SJAV_09060 [Sulfurisphaera javensis]|uniref:MFS transporter n=1 Tax=Sulfurisphaera javensis TaxID=2049879 RepID=A0AAT9GQ44_9CREN
MAIIAGLVFLFYPLTIPSISPIISLIISPAEGIIQLIVLGAFIAFVLPIRTKVAGINLMQVRKLGIITAIGYLVFSLLPYAFIVPFPQTYIGLIIAFNVLNGAVAGGVATFLS